MVQKIKELSSKHNRKLITTGTENNTPKEKQLAISSVLQQVTDSTAQSKARRAK